MPSPWLTGRVSAAVLTRKVDGETPTLLLDESDAAFTGQFQGGTWQSLFQFKNGGRTRYARAAFQCSAFVGAMRRDFTALGRVALVRRQRVAETCSSVVSD